MDDSRTFHPLDQRRVYTQRRDKMSKFFSCNTQADIDRWFSYYVFMCVLAWSVLTVGTVAQFLADDPYEVACIAKGVE